MSEILSPAGTIEAFYAAISNGCNAIYLGLDKYSARAYADNFTIDNLKPLVSFAHLRNVKIYVTINTIVYENELKDVFKTIDQLAEINVDGIIVQDLAVLNYITSNYSSIEAHASTQMGIDDIDGAALVKELGAKRIVFARETPLETIKTIKEKLNIQTEAFIHGALCVAYSGNCLMSSMMGERSGNRGRCAGCCRKLYTLKNLDTDEDIKTGYLLSMKDLNTSSKIEDMSFIDSLKIEGRMKEPNYVANVTRFYRQILDHQTINKEDINKVFNRTYTEGFINGVDSTSLTNIEKPNNYGYLIGKITKVEKGKITIKLNSILNKGDQIRVESKEILEEISIPVLRIFNAKNQIVEQENNIAIIETNKKVFVGANVYKTKDIESIKKAELSLLKKEYSKLPVNMEFSAIIGQPITLKVTYNDIISEVTSDKLVDKALSKPVTQENIKEQLNKLNETPYFLQNLNILMDDNIFIPLKLINELRRNALSLLDQKRLSFEVIRKQSEPIKPKQYDYKSTEICVEVSTMEQYQVAKELGIANIYFENVINRNHSTFKNIDGPVLVGGLNGIYHYRNKNTVISDYSLNVTNSRTVALLSSLGVNRITLSEEMNKASINNLINKYVKTYNTEPNLELIVYGRSKLMHTKYCPLKRLGMCGECKKHKFALNDDFASFPISFNGDCTLNIWNSKTLNIMDELDKLNGISAYRLRFATETPEETRQIITYFKEKINGDKTTNSFNRNIHTHGHFIKNPL